ncbi:uncharacterized protein YjbI with pentapeptide repeats [Oxalobacteraceae bacterium GrIS 2.11]
MLSPTKQSYQSCLLHHTKEAELTPRIEQDERLATLPLAMDTEGYLLAQPENRAKISAIKRILLSSAADGAVKRKIVENAIRHDYKAILNEIFADIRSTDRQINFDGVDLSELNLSLLIFDGISAAGALFNGSDLEEGRFVSANLSGADFSGAHACRTRFFKALFDGTIANGFTTDNSWIQSTWTSVPEKDPEQGNVVNIHLNGVCDTGTFTEELVTLPDRLANSSCVIL